MAWCWVALLILAVCAEKLFAAEYFGKKIGSFSTLYHEVSGDVYAVDSNTLHIRNFKYDGDGPDAYFWAGSTAEPSKDGFIVPDEKGTIDVLQPYRNKHLTLTLPDKKTLKDIKWLSVWCRKFTVDFGNVQIPTDLTPPQPLDLGPIKGVEHGFSTGPVVIVDAQTFMIPDMTLDGLAPDAYFWVGKGQPSPNGTLVLDENGSDKPLGLYDKKTVVISLPSNLTVFDIDYFGVWCRAANADFGHFKMPKTLNIPPNPKMLGQSVKQRLNCEVLNFDPPLEVRWVVSGQRVIVQLVTKIPAGEYISFGLSGHQHQSVMIGGDVVVAWIDRKGIGHAVDYYLDAKAQCAGGRGSCPDNKIKANSSHVTLLNSNLVEGFTMITYTRPLDSQDFLDKPIKKNYPQPVIWAVGPLNSLNEVSYHNVRNFGSQFLVFGRTATWNCPSFDPENRFTPPPQPKHGSSSARPPVAIPETFSQPTFPEEFSQATFDPTTIPSITFPPTTTPPARPPPPPAPTVIQTSIDTQPESVDVEPWYIPPIQCNEPADGVFYAQMGPTGGKRGYSAITGTVGWGIAWYINGLLIPEITVVRGKTYRFVVEGGNDTETPARNHPLYITDDPEGGYAYKSLEERMKVRVYAGIQEGPDGPYPTGLGRLCQWTPVDFQRADEFNSFGEYQRFLTLRCSDGEPGVVTWTPDVNTPDTVYYQCYTHRYLGWKIHVVDECDLDAESSIIREQKVLPPYAFHSKDYPKAKPVMKGNVNYVSHSYKPVFKQNTNHREENSTNFFLVRLQTGFQPLASRKTTTSTPQPKIEIPRNVSIDPFPPNTSIPFHSGFRPGIPDYGGFVSTNRKSSNPFPQKVMLQTSLLAENHPKKESLAQLPMSESEEILQTASSEQSMVIFRTFGGRNIPPLPSHLHLGGTNRRNPSPPKIKIASLQPVSFDGSPVPNAHFSQIQPLPTAESKRKNIFNIQQTRQYGPFKGQKPPEVPDNVPPLPQFNSRNPIKPRAQPVVTTPVSETDYNILNNVWNIISSQGGKGQ